MSKTMTKAAPPEAPAPAAGPARTRKFRVSLNCPTPLKAKSLDVVADDAEGAKRAFDEHNGICGSVHAYSVSEVA